MFRNHQPFEYVITIPHSRGQPRQDTIPPVSSTEELDSESDSDNSDSSTDDDSSDTRTSTREKYIWSMYKQAEASFWTAEEIDLKTDTTD
jgi:U3 small nucleolar RNA-associated protein 14